MSRNHAFGTGLYRTDGVVGPGRGRNPVHSRQPRPADVPAAAPV